MKGQRLKKYLLILMALVIASVGVIVPAAQPAAANHEWSHPHWRSDEYPTVRTPTCYYWGNSTNYCNIVADGAYYWQNHGYDRGYQGPTLPVTGYTRCDPPFHSINICFVASYDARLHGLDGWTDSYSYDFNGDPAHALAAQVYICGDCPLLTQKKMVRHEIGHALGLGHIANTNCMMNLPVYGLNEHGWCQEDVDHMRNMYQHVG